MKRKYLRYANGPAPAPVKPEIEPEVDPEVLPDEDTEDDPEVDPFTPEKPKVLPRPKAKKPPIKKIVANYLRKISSDLTKYSSLELNLIKNIINS